MSYSSVRLIGLEPTQLALLDPKSSASTNFATGAVVECVAPFNFAGAKLVVFVDICKFMSRKNKRSFKF